MKVAFCLVVVAVFPITDAAPEPLHIKNQWNTGLDAYFLVPPSLVGHGWTATITCDRAIDQFEIWGAIVTSIKSGRSILVVQNDDVVTSGDTRPPNRVDIVVRMMTENNIPQCNSEATAMFNGRTTSLPTSLPTMIAGDHMKFNLPMALSAHLLSWGLERWKDAYQSAGQLEMMYDMLKWPLDYFLKCWHPETQEYYAQVGNGKEDHRYWSRPEDMSKFRLMWRPAYKCTRNDTCSDVAGETAAALASGAIVFKDKDPRYSSDLLEAAKSLYDFAKRNQGTYGVTSVQDVNDYYHSNSYKDELCTAAMELYKATNNFTYMQDAMSFFEPNSRSWAFSWDDKNVQCALMLYRVQGSPHYRVLVESFLRSYMPGGDVAQTPCGLAWRTAIGSLRYAANAALVALMAVDEKFGGEDIKIWALKQINYMLGDNKEKMSYQIGYGNKYPTKPYHRASSCPDPPSSPCGWDNINNPGPSPQILKGALVGGPDVNDNYADNHVGCDFNAGFQSALADAAYSQRLLSSAKSLYEFANAHKEIYNKGPISDATSYYGSTGYKDELCVAAMELYKATKDAKYLADAKANFEGNGAAWALSWDDNHVMCELLLYEETKDNRYKGLVESFVRSYMPGGSVHQTPCGLAWRDQWGSLRYAANAAFIPLTAAEDGIGGYQFKS
ncbi:uncharacterized protein LOC111132482 [Crassostrea virginica]